MLISNLFIGSIDFELINIDGLVEISTNNEDYGKVLTRTIGDSSTGTDATPSVPLTTPESSPVIEPAMPPMASRLSSDATLRPSFVQLPSRHSFGFGVDDTLAESSSIRTTSEGHSLGPTWDTGLRVLVVDDDPLTRKLMARMLTRLGCRVSTAENGGIALDLILNGHSSARPTPSSEKYGSAGLSLEIGTPGSGVMDEIKYAVIFLDNQMPIMSGLETVARLREMGRKDFVVGVTGKLLRYFMIGLDADVYRRQCSS
jgi:osomolarity two-component system, sensor histidine kinase SLN1